MIDLDPDVFRKKMANRKMREPLPLPARTFWWQGVVSNLTEIKPIIVEAQKEHGAVETIWVLREMLSGRTVSEVKELMDWCCNRGAYGDRL